MARVSPTCLPYPGSDEAKTFLEREGVVYYKKRPDGIMADVKLMIGLHLYESWNCEGMWNGSLVTLNGLEFATIDWHSKGSHDNEAWIVPQQPRRRLNMKSIAISVPYKVCMIFSYILL